MGLWLHASYYHSASPDKQRALRKNALLPEQMDAEMPEPYRLWRLCERHNTTYWPGGLANQPHLLLMEFAVCASAYGDWQAELANMEVLIRGD